MPLVLDGANGRASNDDVVNSHNKGHASIEADFERWRWFETEPTFNPVSGTPWRLRLKDDGKESIGGEADVPCR